VRIDGELMEIWPNEVCDNWFATEYALFQVKPTCN